MSGHSKWSKIKRQKAVEDSKKSREFSRASRLVALAARKGSDPDINAELRTAIEKARDVGMPQENIRRAIERARPSAGGAGEILEAVTYEFYGPGGVGIIVETITNNRNRTVAELKRLASDHGVKIASPGSVTWAFRKTVGGWLTETTVPLGAESAQKLADIIGLFENHDDVQGTFTNFGG